MSHNPLAISRHRSTYAGSRSRQSNFSKVAGILGEILATLALICGLYVVWQLWWTGVQSEHSQLKTAQTSSWTAPAGAQDKQAKVALAQDGEPPVEEHAVGRGQMVAQLYIPRFGSTWERNVVEGTSPDLLAYEGLGHYTQSQLPGQVGNFAAAGHRAGYGEPLAHVDEFQKGDAIVVRTQNYWYVYHYTKDKIVLPTDVNVIAANPDNPSAQANKRLITLTTCEPKYSTATHRWISWGEFDYWAKVSDGVPQELVNHSKGGGVTFVSKSASPLVKMGSLVPVIQVLLAAYVIIYLAALLAWRYPKLKDIAEGRAPRPYVSMYGWLARHQSGIAPVRALLVILLGVMVACALFQWGFPWLATNIPYLRAMSNYAAF